MAKYLALLPLLASAAFSAPPSHLKSGLAALLARSPAVQHGRLGFQFVDLDSGAILAEQNARTFFTPASNAKLYTTALALVRLGPNYTFRTELRTPGPWHAGEATLPSLQLIGGGDPNLSGRVLPYTVHSVDTDPFAALNELAAKLAASGIREINGDVTGVATRYPGDLFPDGWTVDDTLYDYGAPVSALTLNDNALSIAIAPTTPGELAALTVQPATIHLIVLNQVITSAIGDTSVHITSRPYSNELVLEGTISMNAQPWHQDVAIHNPALFAAESLIGALEEHGITVRGVARSEFIASTEPTTLLSEHESAPLWQDLEVINKVSQNLHAEMLLREVAKVCRGTGTLENGQAERQAFLEQIGITSEGKGVTLADGSGLARQDLATPANTVKLLRYMWNREEHEIWLKTLPIGGQDGSLEQRFQKLHGAARIHAKTGSLSHVNTLSGYLETNHHHWLAFSVMLNATPGPESEVHDFIDHLCALFLNE